MTEFQIQVSVFRGVFNNFFICSLSDGVLCAFFEGNVFTAFITLVSLLPAQHVAKS